MSISPDGGANYLLARFYFPRGFRGTSVYADGDTLYAGTDLSGLAISTDLGPTYNFNRVSYLNGLGSNVVEGVYADGGTVYAATRGGVSISTDGGANFTNYATANVGGDFVWGVYASGGTVYAATQGGLSIGF